MMLIAWQECAEKGHRQKGYTGCSFSPTPWAKGHFTR